jgi:hypothetical protein
MSYGERRNRRVHPAQGGGSMKKGAMTILEAQSIKQDFFVHMEFADTCGKTRAEAYTEVAKKYSPETLAEAMIVLNNQLEEEKTVNEALFTLAIKSRLNPYAS